MFGAILLLILQWKQTLSDFCIKCFQLTTILDKISKNAQYWPAFDPIKIEGGKNLSLQAVEAG